MNVESIRHHRRHKIIKPLTRFIKDESFSGILLVFVTVLALFWANSPFEGSYHKLWETKFTLDIGGYGLSKPLHFWINEGLMAIHLFLIGLEIKREVMIGKLSTLRTSLLPILAAIGGMIVPAIIYISFNIDTPVNINGWAIPMATDLAFALGILTLLGKRVPVALKVFLSALAIVDDIGAVLSIAFFYSEGLLLQHLGIAAGVFLLMFFLNYMGVRNIWVYVVFGIFGLWLNILLSGIHAPVAGVLAALTIPARRKVNTNEFARRIGRQVKAFQYTIQQESHLLLTGNQLNIIDKIRSYCRHAESPLQKLEHRVHGFAIYFVMPVFAFANTGLPISANVMEVLYTNSASSGIFFGLLFGKVIGVSLFALLSVRLGIAALPEGVTPGQIIGLGFLAGIGFTMSVFISELAFYDEDLTTLAKKAIFAASFLSGVIGYVMLRFFLKNKRTNT